MRIISGKLKGRILVETHGKRTHPMSEKMRGAIFNSLGDISGLTILDAFSGTGALAIEAISRGAYSAVAIDNDKDAYKTTLKNVLDNQLGDKILVVRRNVKSWSSSHSTMLFDVVLADAPFDEVNDTLLEKVGRHTKPGGVFVVCAPTDFTPRNGLGYNLVQKNKHGDAHLLFYRH